MAPSTDPRSIRADGAAFTYAGAARPAFRDLTLEVEPGQLLLIVTYRERESRRWPRAFADVARVKLRTKRAELEAALTGRVRPITASCCASI